MIRVKLIVSGKVQAVGYRDFVCDKAYELGIKGVVKNLKDGTVEIVAEADKDNMDLFIKSIKIREFPIIVGNVHISEEEPTGKFTDFKKIRTDLNEETLERADEAARYMRLMYGEMAGFRKETKSSFDDMGGRYDRISQNMFKIEENMSKHMTSIHGILRNPMHENLVVFIE